jgi:hypothetical protein
MARTAQVTACLLLFVPMCAMVLAAPAAPTNTPADPRPSRASAQAAAKLSPQNETGSRKDYAGAEACASCHQNIAQSYQLTAHNRSTTPATRANVLGSFDAGKNVLETLDPALHFRMEAKGDGLFQEAVLGDPPKAKTRTERMDVVFGGRPIGQSYAYWKGDRLFELPVSYWQGAGWVNSPGYLDGTADFDRPITPRCMECHASFAKTITETQFSNQFVRGTVELGITCERCHGPGAGHVALHSAGATMNGADVPTADLVDLAKASREQKMQACAQCHAGLGKDLRPAFTYKPGEELSAFVHLDPPDPRMNVDVHGNQVAALERSRCYAESTAMTCTTCHNPHETTRIAASYSATCLTCHQVTQCGEFAHSGDSIAQRCVDCHMPVQESKLIESSGGGKELKAELRNHWIKVWPARPAAPPPAKPGQ